MLTAAFRGICVEQASIESAESAPVLTRKRWRHWRVAGLTLAAGLLAASGAQAQNCTVGPVTPPGGVPNAGAVGLSPAAIGSMIGSSITASSTAFLLQSSSFVGAPANPAPDQQGSGIWVRGVGGEVTVKSTTNTNLSAVVGGVTGSASVFCSEKVRDDFAGIQFGRDISELNVNGWNLHAGATAGFLSANSTMVGGAATAIDAGNGGIPEGGGPLTSSAQVPFIGFYGAATKGGFFADGLLRAEYYQNSVAAPGLNLFGQQVDAHGWSFSGSTGYNYQIPNSKWFIEPSGSLIVSRVSIDPFTFSTAGNPGPTLNTQIPGTLTFNQIKSDIGRVGVRVGETITAGNVVWQPFAAVSVWHEFGPNATANYLSSPLCCTGVGMGSGSISTIGTFGQYSLGVSGSLVGTGWLGFARVDYRDGPNLQGLSGTGGIRYQFDPEPVAHTGIFKAKAPPAAVQVVNWTGIYVGAFAGATLGTADWGYGVGEVAPHIGGFLGGGEIGADWQTGKWVVGAVADLSGTNTRGGTACNPAGAVIFPPGPFAPMQLADCNASAGWIGDVAGRLGYAWDRVLFYAKAGGAWTNERFAANCTSVGAGAPTWPCTTPTGAVTTGFSASTNRTGWIAGYGAQFALTQNLSAKAETDYVTFGDTNVIASNGSALHVGMHVWEEKIGLDYKFHTGP
jgi:outer membrane autotransporter protein